jgi:hypothetical protein
MDTLHYASGERVRVGDIVDVGHGRGPRATVVVVIPTGEAAEGFTASEWAYLRDGVMLQDTVVFGLLHLSELDHEHVLVQRAQQ